MEKAPKISVIVPVYNTAIYLDRLFTSLMDQTEQDFEMVFVDDGSSDGSGELLLRFQALDRRVRVIAQENRGGAVARNVGFEASCGELVVFVDSDDFVAADFLEHLERPFEDPSVGMAICEMDDYIEAEGRYRDKPGAVSDAVARDVPFAPKSHLNLFKDIVAYPGNKMVRRSIVTDFFLRFQDLPSHDDLSFIYGAMALSPKIVVLDEVLYHYRRRADCSSITDTTMAERYQCGFLAVEELRRILKRHDRWGEFAQTYVNYALHMCRWKLDVVPGDKKADVRNELRDEWFRKLDILGYPRSWYLNDYEYDLMCACLNFERDKELRSRIAALQEQTQKLESGNGRLAEDNERLAIELERVRSSHSFKLGYGLTALPRAIKSRIRR